MVPMLVIVPVMVVVVILIAFAVIGTSRSNPTQDAQDAVARERQAARKAERARRRAEHD
jgi:type II secretory pathway pseudopilin PulG